MPPGADRTAPGRRSGGRPSEAEVAARRALGMVKAAEKLVGQALGARLIERGWQPGQPVDEGSRRLQAAAPQLRAVAEALQQLDASAERQRRSPPRHTCSDGSQPSA